MRTSNPAVGIRTLAKWLARSDAPSQVDFAGKVKCSESHLSLVLQGKRGVSPALAMRISKATGDAVPAGTLVSGDVAQLLREVAA